MTIKYEQQQKNTDVSTKGTITTTAKRTLTAITYLSK